MTSATIIEVFQKASERNLKACVIRKADELLHPGPEEEIDVLIRSSDLAAFKTLLEEQGFWRLDDPNSPQEKRLQVHSMPAIFLQTLIC